MLGATRPTLATGPADADQTRPAPPALTWSGILDGPGPKNTIGCSMAAVAAAVSVLAVRARLQPAGRSLQLVLSSGRRGAAVRPRVRSTAGLRRAAAQLPPPAAARRHCSGTADS